MSYVSILKNIPEIISQPASIAALASVGLHGAIALTLPLMPVDSSKSKASTTSKTVPVVELNQAQQNRLPQAPNSLALQPLPGQVPGLPNFGSVPSVLPPIPPAPPQGGLATLPKSFNNLPVDSIPKQSNQALPRSTQLRIDNSFNAKTAYQSFPRFDKDIKAATSQGLPRSTAPVIVGRSQPLPSYSSAPVIATGNQPLPRYSSAPVTVPESQPISPGNLPELQANNVPPDVSSNSAPLVSETTPGTTVPENTTANGANVPNQEEFVAPVGETPQTNDNLALAGQTVPQWQQQQPTVSTPSSATQQALAKTTTFGDQFREVKQQYPNIETRQLISQTINARGQEGKVEGSLVVDTEGKVADIKFLDSSVSSDLKTATREYFREYFQKNPAQANGKPDYYPFNLAFKSNGSNLEPTTAIPNPPPIQNNQIQNNQIQNNQIQNNQNIIPSQPLRSPRAIPPQSSQPTQDNSSVSQQPAAKLPPLRVVRKNSLPTLEAAKSGLPELQITNNSSLPAPESTAKPTLSQPAVTNNSSTRKQAITVLSPRTGTNQPVIPGGETVKPASPQLQARTNQLVTPTNAQENAKPVSRQPRAINNQPQASQQATAKPAPQSQVSSNQSTSATESSKKLIEQLRQVRDKKQTSNQEK